MAAAAAAARGEDDLILGEGGERVKGVWRVRQMYIIYGAKLNRDRVRADPETMRIRGVLFRR